MAGDLMPFSGGAGSQGFRNGLVLRRETRAVERGSAVERLHEQARLDLAETRLQNGTALAGQAVLGAAGLDALITVVSGDDNPFLEMDLRRLQRATNGAAGAVVARYMLGL